jgi:hypothetical protein
MASSISKLALNPAVQTLVKEALTGNIDPSTIAAVTSAVTSSSSPDIRALGTPSVPEPRIATQSIFVSENMVPFLVIFILSIWAFIMIYCNAILEEKETKDNIKFTHYVLFGGFGIIPIIGAIISLLICLSLIPSVDNLISAMRQKLKF